MRTTDYLEKVLESAKEIMSKAGLIAVWERIHLAARGHAGGKGRARAIAEAGKATDSELLKMHSLHHDGSILFSKGIDGQIVLTTGDAEGQHAVLHAEMQRRQMVVLDAELGVPEETDEPDGIDLDTDVHKPYGSIEDLPEGAKGLPKHGKEIMLAAFNAAYRQYKGDEAKAWAVAWAAVKTKYQKKGEEWVAKTETGILKADEKGNIYSLAAIADDEAIAKWEGAGKADEDTPTVVDTQGEWMSEATLTEMAEGYLATVTGPGRVLKVYKAEDGSIVFVGGTDDEIAKAVDGHIGVQHKAALKDAQLLQSAVIYKGTRWPEPDSPPLDIARAWAWAAHTDDEDVKKAVREGRITGLSIGGRGERVE